MGTFILHPDRYIFRDQPLDEAVAEAVEELLDASDALLAVSYSRGDRADDPATKAGYRLRYLAKLLADLMLERQNQPAQKKKKTLQKTKVSTARKSPAKKRKTNHG